MIIRTAVRADLDAINRVIEAAVMNWALPERVKRLSLPSYRYTEVDFKHLKMVVAENDGATITAVAAWESAENGEIPAGRTALLLHGIFVDPIYHRRGIGRQLCRTVEEAARRHQFDGLVVKAQQDADGFFIAQGMRRLPVEDPLRQYGNRFWKDL